MNHLESLTAEFLEFAGYFVRKNVQVAPRSRGGYEGELDVVAIHPVTRHVLHVEPSLDALPWSKRQKRFARKFALGRAHIPQLFDGLDAPADIDQVALLVFASRKNVTKVGGARLLLVGELMHEIVAELRKRPVERAAVPEQFPCLRSIQFACQFAGVGVVDVPGIAKQPLVRPRQSHK
tara:strand:- start:42549 stop:43085 length:537 start_codon:yes stop_codon:yes gene_type:complete